MIHMKNKILKATLVLLTLFAGASARPDDQKLNWPSGFLRLANGHLLLIYNDSMNRRTPLAAALSLDNDKSYPYRRNLAEGAGDFAYPFAIQTRDGKIHVVYTSDRRSVINHGVFEEGAILSR